MPSSGENENENKNRSRRMGRGIGEWEEEEKRRGGSSWTRYNSSGGVRAAAKPLGDPTLAGARLRSSAYCCDAGRASYEAGKLSRAHVSTVARERRRDGTTASDASDVLVHALGFLGELEAEAEEEGMNLNTSSTHSSTSYSSTTSSSTPQNNIHPPLSSPRSVFDATFAESAKGCPNPCARQHAREQTHIDRLKTC
ncbi:hypothetical protein CYLTODRAFT_415017 [Cylindrobasidium torrendii FP15055 ss-10]|uniref:Uncharacterized protein n=1 Tax=Cylindrobasidium torrendii FP15055 ss-10 TaxID=1314674 RepID=A0A0D7AVK8_9AGAR|nr:hypothetical protein CYLTODRAFT_415017 [Cylindrobasidium torrendii FP15055 ss-10]